MKTMKIIGVLAVFAVVFMTSCAKMDPLNEKEGVVFCGTGECGVEDDMSKAMFLESEDLGNEGITDPDHDEDHDKDDSHESREE